jgi:thiamine-phosphate pyrophosphorylase
VIKYAITAPDIYTPKYLKQLNNRADFVLFRDKSTKEYAKLAKDFIKHSKEYSYKKIIHQDYLLAKKLGAFGVHLTSTQFSNITKAKELGLFVIVSTHSLSELNKAYNLGADAATYSPIFTTPNKGTPKGVVALKEAVKQFDIKIIALGGIVSQKEIEKVKNTKAWGFASIRYFAL